MHPHKQRGVGTRIQKSATHGELVVALRGPYLSHGKRRSCGTKRIAISFLFSEVCLAHSRVSRRCVSNTVHRIRSIFLVFTDYHCDGFPLGGNMHTTTYWTASTTWITTTAVRQLVHSFPPKTQHTTKIKFNKLATPNLLRDSCLFECRLTRICLSSQSPDDLANRIPKRLCYRR
jgi:hypothetical protein